MRNPCSAPVSSLSLSYISCDVWAPHVSACTCVLSPTVILPVTSPFSLRALRETFSNECTRSEESCGKGGKKRLPYYQPVLKIWICNRKMIKWYLFTCINLDKHVLCEVFRHAGSADGTTGSLGRPLQSTLIDGLQRHWWFPEDNSSWLLWSYPNAAMRLIMWVLLSYRDSAAKLTSIIIKITFIWIVPIKTRITKHFTKAHKSHNKIQKNLQKT